MKKTHIEKDYYFHADAGHGWLAVPRKTLQQLNLIGLISRYSYQRGKTVYLEEDCDAPIFIKKMENKYGRCISIKLAKHCDYSPIRSYQPFTLID